MRAGGDAGSAATEYVSMLFLFLFALAGCFEVYASFTTVEKVEDAARAGARVGAMRGAAAGGGAARAALPGWLGGSRVAVSQRGDTVVCEVRARVPPLFPGVPFGAAVERRVSMPVGG
ncbi:TadE/TadG family type IV pilus assembly protein [Actinomadura atramentaria]|uniref:TadE/TadG family type IV pilus assembly protein n=1 Tax=Actinomadura atramentaria TaxID=1990 RepID=UPI000365A294|nr:TadE/TadG family type IV pilus assembly protein [Actinomadura atramentaria]